MYFYCWTWTASENNHIQLCFIFFMFCTRTVYYMRVFNVFFIHLLSWSVSVHLFVRLSFASCCTNSNHVQMNDFFITFGQYSFLTLIYMDKRSS